ncbi:MAG: BT_3928 family protein [Bacteroidota bacterium]
MKIITQISRIFVGVLFIISGLIKANDTLGFSYKLEEYFEVFNMTFFVPYAVGLAMFICIFEIICGIALLLGAYTKLNAWLLLLMIVFFTLLTGYSAITHKVTDCGCFGDAIKLKPIESFYKDLILLALILIIFIGQKHIQPLMKKTLQNLAMSVSLLVVTFFTFYTYMFLPVKDFLPYKIGNNIKEKMVCPPGSPVDSIVMMFVYEKNGVKEEFDMNHIPSDTNYKFVDRKDVVVREGCKPPIHDFNLTGENDINYTDSLFASQGYKLVLVQKSIDEGRKGLEKQIAQLAADCINDKKEFWALTSTAADRTEKYRHENQMAFKYYMVDVVPLKSMVRSNPGLILMKGSTVVKKWSAYNFPTYDIVVKYMQ